MFNLNTQLRFTLTRAQLINLYISSLSPPFDCVTRLICLTFVFVLLSKMEIKQDQAQIEKYTRASLDGTEDR